MVNVTIRVHPISYSLRGLMSFHGIRGRAWLQQTGWRSMIRGYLPGQKLRMELHSVQIRVILQSGLPGA
ncbi:hypothetical protein ASZ90_010080 [hydrocarbon metagenome]|uniref:Uncharacterized protein n=1 Tax=hydrocarbon metagenome TaxID=938273 RepID=A0A0W8FH14_9ZZZZ